MRGRNSLASMSSCHILVLKNFFSENSVLLKGIRLCKQPQIQQLLTLYVEHHTLESSSHDCSSWSMSSKNIRRSHMKGSMANLHEVPFQIYVRHSAWEVFVMDQLKGFLVQEEFGGPIVEGEPGSH